MECNKKTNDLLRKVTNRFIDMIVEEMNNEELKTVIRKKLINPLLSMIYTEVYPYLYGLLLIVILILLFTLLTFFMFFIQLFKRTTK